MARPGGNLTGVSRLATERLTKQLENLMAMAPKLKRIGFLLDPSVQVARKIGESVQAAADCVGPAFMLLEAPSEKEIE